MSDDSTTPRQVPARPAPKMLDPILIDLYPGDYGGHPPIDKMVAWAPACGVSLKASEGTYYKPVWFQRYWPLVRQAGGDRFGQTWFRGSYHFLKFDTPGHIQADYYMQAIDEAGGWDAVQGDLPPCIDAEGGGGNDKASRQQIVDCLSSCSERLKAATGRLALLYANIIPREAKPPITSRCGFDYLWFPDYEAVLDRRKYESFGWSVDSLFAWQYAGNPDGGKLHGYPLTVPSSGQALCDLSAVQVDLAALCRGRVPPHDSDAA